ncbi:MAG: LPS-assembly protein LptD [Nitrospirae bacterium]|nr:MAG: LPS-assembly protein LptD [Nitrospirota bacterium]
MRGARQTVGSWQSAVGSLMVFIAALLFFASNASATNITADKLEHFKNEDKFTASGNVRIERNGTVVTAEKAIYYQSRAEAILEGKVMYEDEYALINAEKAEINIDNKTGKLFNAIIQLKDKKSRDTGQDVKYRFSGDNVQRLSADHYYVKTASFTTCGSEEGKEPDWCFKGRNVDVVVGRRITANEASFNVAGIPVAYSPYVWAPVLTERQSGLLFPAIGNSSQKGVQFSPSYFWAIDENKDATIGLDYYGKRGLGKGLEYRYIYPDSNGKWYGYHLRDNRMNKTFLEFKGEHRHNIGEVKAFTDINYLNERDFYKEYARHQDARIQRFLQSSAEASLPGKNWRLYLLGQSWKDLKGTDDRIPQRLPELGYVLNPTPAGPFVFNLSSSLANFTRDRDTKAQRFDIHPAVSHTVGNDVTLTQKLSLRETVYNMHNTQTYESWIKKGAVEYSASTLTRLSRSYEGATHILEPSVGYRFISGTKSVPLLDSTELFQRTTQAYASLYNSLVMKDLTVSAKALQPYDFNPQPQTQPLLPTKLEAVISGPAVLRFDVTQDFAKGRTDSTNSELSVKVTDKSSFSVGERYNREANIKLYKAGIDAVINKQWAVKSDASYDFKMHEFRDATAKIIYSQKCWALNTAITRRPGYGTRPPEYGFMVFFELKGLGGEHRFL